MQASLLRSIIFIAVLITTGRAVPAQSAQDRYPFGRGDKVGFIDFQGREVIPERFSNAGERGRVWLCRQDRKNDLEEYAEESRVMNPRCTTILT